MRGTHLPRTARSSPADRPPGRLGRAGSPGPARTGPSAPRARTAGSVLRPQPGERRVRRGRRVRRVRSGGDGGCGGDRRRGRSGGCGGGGGDRRRDARRRGPARRLCRRRSSGRSPSTDTPELSPQPQRQPASRAARPPHTLRRHSGGPADASPRSLLSRLRVASSAPAWPRPLPVSPSRPAPALRTSGALG